MTDYEVYKLYFEEDFPGIEPPGEHEEITKFEMDTIFFQTYLLRFRCRELVEELDAQRRAAVDAIKKIAAGIKRRLWGRVRGGEE